MFEEKLEVILPVYNESACISKTIEEVKAFSLSHPEFYFTFFDDGSTDETPSILKERLQNEKRINYVLSGKNQGKALAIKTGILLSKAEYVIFTDGDLAYSLDYLHTIKQKLNDYDIIIGNRNLGKGENKRSYIRMITGESFNFLTQILLRLHYSDTQAGLKGFSRNAIVNLLALQTVTNFAFDAELLYLARLKGLKVGEIPVAVSTTHAAKTSSVDVFKDSLKMLFSLLKIVTNSRLGRYNG